MTKLLTVVGARPQFVKASAISRAIAAAPGITEVLVHTGQHSDEQMSAAFFRELTLPTPDYNLSVSGGLHGQMTGRMLQGIAEVIERERPAGMLVFGDTNSTLAGALAAAKLSIPVTHVEAGLRSFKRTMPEEINRVLTDRVSTLLCCPTRTSVDNLEREGFSQVLAAGDLVGDATVELTGSGPWVANVGDVMLDVLLRHRELAATSTILQRLSVDKGGYGVLTIHRAENATRIETLRQILAAVRGLGRLLPIVFVVHPRTRALLASAGEQEALSSAGIMAIDPLSYLDFLHLQANAKVILTDSGGVQKEACFLGVPCLTLRDETEWPETVTAGYNTLVGNRPDDLAQAVRDACTGSHASQAFGKGDAASRIVKLVLATLAR